MGALKMALFAVLAFAVVGCGDDAKVKEKPSKGQKGFFKAMAEATASRAPDESDDVVTNRIAGGCYSVTSHKVRNEPRAESLPRNETLQLEDGSHGIALTSDELPPSLLVIDVARSGQVSLPGFGNVSDEIVSCVLKERVDRYGKFPCMIRADKRTQHEKVRRVMDLCAKAGVFEFSFVAGLPRSDGEREPEFSRFDVSRSLPRGLDKLEEPLEEPPPKVLEEIPEKKPEEELVVVGQSSTNDVEVLTPKIAPQAPNVEPPLAPNVAPSPEERLLIQRPATLRSVRRGTPR